MSDARISVLLPNYNNEKYLKQCLDSLFNQTYQKFVLYFIDDCSTDGSVAILQEYDESKIVLIKKEKNSGIVDTLNEGLRRIKTEYFIRLDGDDENLPERFEKLIQFMDNNPDIDVCGSGLKTFGCREDIQLYPTNVLLNRARLIFGHSLAHPTCIFRTEKIQKNNIFYTNDFYRLEDYTLFYALKDIAKTTNLKEVLYLYRQEEYNYNPDLLEVMSVEYKKFYKMLLLDLNPNISDSDVLLHLELSGKVDPSHCFKKYKAHVKQIIRFNKINQLYPCNELKEVLFDRLYRLQFLLIDQGLFKVEDLSIFTWKQNFKVVRYFLGKKKLK